jgi:hypothetical protein
MAALKPNSPMEKELKRLVLREGFHVYGGTWDDRSELMKPSLPNMQALRRILADAPKSHWAGFQLYYAMTEDEVRDSTGLDLVEAMLAIFSEVTTVMNLCMHTELKPRVSGF